MQYNLFGEDDYDVELGDETRVCIKCERELDLVLFPIDAYHANGDVRRRPECVDCRKSAQKQTRILRKSAPPVPENHHCPICLRDKDGIKGTNHPSHNSWCLDHSHSTGNFRGWICHQCNRMLGIAKDNSDLLRRAIIYLEGKENEVEKDN